MDADKKTDAGKMNGTHHLSPIIMNHRRFINADKTIYRIYTNASQFTLVEADSAHEAYTKSGVSRAHKIERDLYTRYSALSREQLTPSDKQTHTNVELPDADELRTFLIAAFGDDALPHKADFEEMAIGDLQKGVEPEVVPPVETASIEPSGMDEATAPELAASDLEDKAAAASEPEEEIGEHVLSPEEVEALLNS